MRRIICLCAVLLVATSFITGCVFRYKPLQEKGSQVGDHNFGYWEKQVAPDQFVIYYEGHELNSVNTAEVAAAMAELRAAELTLEKGYAYFVVLVPPQPPQEHKIAMYDNLMVECSEKRMTTNEYSKCSRGRGALVEERIYHTSNLQIRLLQEKSDPAAIDAAERRQQIRSQHKAPAKGPF